MTGDGRRDFWRVLVSLVVPPLGVFLQVGIGPQFWINVALCILFWLPAQVHAVWVITHIGPGGRENPNGLDNFVSLLLSFYLPPVGVLLKRGVGVALLLNVALTSLGWFPGAIHALWVITAEEPTGGG